MSSPLRSSGSPKRILVVDDDATNRELAAHILRMSGLLVDIAPSGADALAMYAERERAGGRHEVVVTDLLMPGMSGTDLAGELLRQPDPPRLVCLTGRVGPTTLDRCAASGFDVVLTKPYRMGSLLLAVMGRGQTQASMPAMLATNRIQPMRRLRTA